MAKKILIIGAGIVGQANGKGFIKKGHDVTFIDNNPCVVTTLRNGGFTTYDSDNFYGHDNNTSNNKHFDIAMFCLPTPFKDNISIDLTYLNSAIVSHSKWLKEYLNHNNKKGRKAKHCFDHIIVIRSTVIPGTTRSVLLPLIESHGQVIVGKDVGLCMQPEFLRTASSETDFLNPHATVIGQYDKLSGDDLESLYTGFPGQRFRTDLETAEFTKYIQNCFNATKISFANEMWLLGQKLGLDANSALRLASVTGEGFWNPCYGTLGGKSYDGSCLPKDVKTFLSFANGKNVDMPLLQATDLVNSNIMHRTSISTKRGEVKRRRTNKSGSGINNNKVKDEMLTI
jgi:UDPglucose 6-dehydrogenase